MRKAINTKLDRLNITGQKDPDWLYSGAGGKNKDVVNDLEHLNAIGEYDYIAPVELRGLNEFETGGPDGANVYRPVELDTADYGRMGGDTSIFDFGSGEFWDDLFRGAGKSAEQGMSDMGLTGAGAIGSDNYAKQLMKTPKSAQEITKNYKPKALSGNWLSGMLTSAASAASKLVSGGASGGSGAGGDDAAQQAGTGEGASGSGSNGRAWLIAGGIGLVVMGIIGTVIIVKSRAKK